MSDLTNLLTNPVFGGSIVAGVIGGVGYYFKWKFDRQAKREDQETKERERKIELEAAAKLRQEEREAAERKEDKEKLVALEAKVQSLLADTHAQLKQNLAQAIERIETDKKQNDVISANTAMLAQITSTLTQVAKLMDQMAVLLARLEK